MDRRNRKIKLRWIIGAIVMVLIIGLLFAGTGCFRSDSSSSGISNLGTSSESAPLEVIGAVELIELETAYAEVLRAYAKGISMSFAGYGQDDSFVSEQFMSFDMSTMRAEYTFQDVDMVGAKELLVGVHYTIDGAEYDKVQDIWTISQGKFVRLPNAQHEMDQINKNELPIPLDWIRFSWKNYGVTDIASVVVGVIGEKTDWNAVYAAVIQAYTYGIATDFEGYKYNNDDSQNIISDHFGSFLESELKLHYTFYDIDGNGTKELLLGSEYDFIGWICNIWTVVDGQLKPLIMEQIPYNGIGIIDHGRIAQSIATDGSGYIVYKIEENGFSLTKEIYFSSLPEGFFYQNYGDTDIKEPQEISETEYDRVKSKYVFKEIVAFDWTNILESTISQDTVAEIEGFVYTAKNGAVTKGEATQKVIERRDQYGRLP